MVKELVLLVGFLVAMDAAAWMEHNQPNFKWQSVKGTEVTNAVVKARYLKALGYGKDQDAEWFLGSTSFVCSEVLLVDLNDDKVTDTVVIYPWVGCGLNANATTADFLISDGKGGRVHTSIQGYGQSTNDIGVVNGKKYFFTSDFIPGNGDFGELKTGHNYWLYCPYEFLADGTMAEASEKVGSPFPALTIFYDNPKFVAQELTPQFKDIIKKNTTVESVPFEFSPTKP